MAPRLGPMRVLVSILVVCQLLLVITYLSGREGIASALGTFKQDMGQGSALQGYQARLLQGLPAASVPQAMRAFGLGLIEWPDLELIMDSLSPRPGPLDAGFASRAIGTRYYA